MSKFEDVDFKNLKFSSTKKTTGMRFIQVFHEKKPLEIKLPKLKVPFDCKLNLYNQLELNISLGDNESLIQTITSFDEQMKVYASENNWGTQYTPMLKVSDKGYPPTIRVKFTIKDNNVDTSFYDESRNKMDINSIENVISVLKWGTMVKSAITCVGVWMKDNKYGVTWKLSQIQIFPKNKPVPQENVEYLFESDEEFSDQELLIDE